MQQLKIFALLLILALGSVKSNSIYQRNGESYVVYGDVEIIINSTTWKCDRIYCPRDTTERCVVTKQNLPDNPTVVRRENNCFSANNRSLKSHVEDENVGPNVHISGSIVATRNGIVSSNINNSNIGISKMDPETERKFNESMQKLEENLQKMNREFQENLDRTLNNVDKEIQQAFGNIRF